MNKIAILFFLVLIFFINGNSVNAMPLSRLVLSEEHLLVSDIYTTHNKNLYLVTSNGVLLVFDLARKAIIQKIDLGGRNAIYDHDVISAIDNEKSILYISFNRTLYVVDTMTHTVKNKIYLIKNPDKIIVKSGSNKIWLLDTSLGVLGSVDDVLSDSSKKDSIKYLKFVKRPQEVFFDSKLSRLYLIDSKSKFIYILNGNDKIISTVDYREEIKNIESIQKGFNSVVDGDDSEIVISQLKSFSKEKLFALDKESHKLYISLNDAVLVFNLITNTFEKRFKNLPPSKKFIVSGGKIYLLFESGNTNNHALAIIDESGGKLIDLTVLGNIKNITLDKENKKIFALSEYVKSKPDYLIIADLNEQSLSKKSFLNQFDKAIGEIDKLIISNKDIRLLKLYKNISPTVEKIKLIRKNKEKDLSCTPLIGNYIKDDIKYHVKRFITPCVSGDDRTKPCLDYYRIKDLANFLEALVAVDFNQNNLSDFCEIK